MEVADAELRSLLMHDAFVRRIARGIVDSATVEDVVQETWWAAVRRRGVFTRPLPPWLNKVARHLALNARRAEARRQAREALAARPEALPSTASLLEREAVRQSVVEAVFDLPEPLRGTVVLRYFDGLSPREIARRVGAPVETVRSRLKRAFKVLRERFVSVDLEPRKSFGAVLLALAYGPRLPVAAWAAGKSALLGAMAMSTGPKVATGVAALLLVVALVVVPWYFGSRHGESVGTATIPESSDSSDGEQLVKHEGQPMAPIIPRPSADEASELLVQSASGRPIHGASVFPAIPSHRSIAPARDGALAKSDELGMVVLPTIPASDDLVVWARGYVSASVHRPGPGQRSIVTLTAGMSHRVICTDLDGKGVANVRLAMSQINLEPSGDGDEQWDEAFPASSPRTGIYRASTGADGVADFQSVAPGTYLCHIGHNFMIPKLKRPMQVVDVSQDGRETKVQLCEVYGIAFKVIDDEVIYYDIEGTPNSEFFQSQLTYRGEIEERLKRKWPDCSVVAWVPSQPTQITPSKANVILRDGGERSLPVTFVPVRTLQPTTFDRVPREGGSECGSLTIRVKTSTGEAVPELEFEVRPMRAPRVAHVAFSATKKNLPAATYLIRPKAELPAIPEPGREVVIERGGNTEVKFAFDQPVRRCRLDIDCGNKIRLDRVSATVSMTGIQDQVFWSAPPFLCLLPPGSARVTVRMFGVPEVTQEFTVGSYAFRELHLFSG